MITEHGHEEYRSQTPRRQLGTSNIVINLTGAKESVHDILANQRKVLNITLYLESLESDKLLNGDNAECYSTHIKIVKTIDKKLYFKFLPAFYKTSD